MLKFLKKNSTSSLQKKYDKLMKEAYMLSKANPAESKKKQEEAEKVHRQLIAKRAA